MDARKTLHGGGGTMRINSMSMFSTALNALKRNQSYMEKSMKTCREQIDNIEYLRNNDMLDLLDDKIKIVINYREKYPETTMSELANIISIETETNITKSGINHYFRKIKDLVNKDKNKL